MAAIVATIDAMKEEKVVENAATIGNEVLRPGLSAGGEVRDYRQRERPRSAPGAGAGQQPRI